MNTLTEVNTAALLRLSLISALFLLNAMCIMRMLCCAIKLNHCVHTITCGFVLLCSSVYLSSWLPYLFHSFYNSSVWPLIDIKDHCIIQHSVSGQITTILLALLCIRKLYDAFSPTKAKSLSYAACIAWIVPQLVYLTMAEIVNVDDNSSYQFLDRVPHNFSETAFSQSQHPKPGNEGFMICVHKMTSAVIAQMSWHYVVLVIPLTVMLLICLAANYIKHSFNNSLSKIERHCNCSNDVVLSICLYLNFSWLLLFRPLVVLRTLMSQSNDQTANNEWQTINPFVQQTDSVYLDFGSHLIIIILSIIVPFSSQGGFRTDLNQRKNMKLNKYCPTTAIKALEANYFDLDIAKDSCDKESEKRIKISNSYYSTNTL